MNPYKDWMMALYKKRMMNDKNGRSVPDARLLIARKRLALALDPGRRAKKK